MITVAPTPTRRPPAAEESSLHRRWRPTGRTAFFGVLLVVFLGYTEMAFQLEWVTRAGRIGPGFFPRIIGGLAVVVTLWAVVDSLRREDTDESGVLEEDTGEGDLGRHPAALLVAVAASAVLVLTLTSLGAILASAVFLFGLLSYLNRGRWLVNVVLSIAVPVGLYLLFQTALNAGLPSGLLPRF